MKAENWEKLENIFHAALSLPGGERQPFLARECGGDPALLSEVESLIENFEGKPEFMGEPVFEIGLGALHEATERNLAGSVIGAYEIKEKIGAGGMGEVYKAFDRNLNRTVALKFLPDSLKSDASARRRLAREAQAAAALEHPNICTVYGFEQRDEHHFIVMQFVEGETLGESFSEKRPGVEEFKNIARQIFTGVAFAHAHGVVHRDLKPGNIMLTADRQIKILDFGLAKIDPAKQLGGADELSVLSTNGLVIGTVAYMSPEQLRGERLDYRSDIFSVGVILHKLLTGESPFSRASQAETIAAILSETISFEAIKEKAADFPENYLRMVEKCLQKDKKERFESVPEVLVEFDKAELSQRISEARPRRRAAFFLRLALAVVFLAALAAVLLFTSSRDPNRTLAVLPISFENAQADKEYLADGLTQNIIDKLSNLSDLKVKNELSIAKFKEKPADARAAGRELDADAVFSAVIRNRPNGLVLETRIIRSSDGALIDTFEWQMDESRLVGLPEEIAARIVSKVDSRLTDAEKDKLTRKDTESNEAKEFYMKGRYFLKTRKEARDPAKAIEAFTSAKDLDIRYARAWAGLADAYLAQSAPGVKNAITPKEAVESARLAANKALELDNTLCDTYNALGLISYRYDWDWQKAEDYFRRAMELDSEFLPARINLLNVLKTQERYEEALAEARRIKEIDPLSIASDIQVALIYYRKQDFAAMDRVLSELPVNSRNEMRVKYVRVYHLLKTGRFEEAVELFAPLYNSANEEDKVYAAAPLGFAYARMKRRDEALRIIADLDKLGKKNYVPAQEKALIYVGLGNYDKVFEFLRASCEERFASLPGWINDPIVADIKTDARFAAIRECAKL